MDVTRRLGRYGARRLVRRFSRSIPLIGTVAALAALGGAVRRKGMLGGLVHSALDATPLVGTMKAVIETGRGKDLIPDRVRKIPDWRPS